jgi:hypothetical protein
MIWINISVRNPFWRSRMDKGFRNYFSRERLITANKFVGIDITRHWYYLCRLAINIGWQGEDHAGPSIEIELLGHGVQFYLRDRRHWNYDEDRWWNPDEDITA